MFKLWSVDILVLICQVVKRGVKTPGLIFLDGLNSYDKLPLTLNGMQGIVHKPKLDDR